VVKVMHNPMNRCSVCSSSFGITFYLIAAREKVQITLRCKCQF